jgi:hypothetical protein
MSIAPRSVYWTSYGQRQWARKQYGFCLRKKPSGVKSLRPVEKLSFIIKLLSQLKQSYVDAIIRTEKDYIVSFGNQIDQPY